MGDFETLRAAIDLHRAGLNQPVAGWPDEEFLKRIPDLPLVHRLGRPLRTTTASTVSLEPAESKVGRDEIGTDRRVFASYGRAVFLTPPIVLVFGPASRAREGRRSTPWDSRGGVRAAGKDGTWLEYWTLDAALDEQYLALHLATIFQSWQRYLASPFSPPLERDPAGVCERGSRKDWMVTPEARFDRSISMDDLLLAALVDVDHADFDLPEWRSTIGRLSACARTRDASFRRLSRNRGSLDLPGEVERVVRSCWRPG